MLRRHRETRGLKYAMSACRSLQRLKLHTFGHLGLAEDGRNGIRMTDREFIRSDAYDIAMNLVKFGDLQVTVSFGDSADCVSIRDLCDDLRTH